MSGPELASRLEVGVRTVRRYITMLQDLGIPVQGQRGRYGTYLLRPGYKLPPLMFSEDEALALIIGLLSIRRSRSVSGAVDAESALAKVARVMPRSLQERVRAVQETVVLDGRTEGARPSSSVVGAFSEATRQCRRLRMRYRSAGAEHTEREIDPYGLIVRQGWWYAVGYCHLRKDTRVFRVDRVLEVELGTETFTRPRGFDVQAYVERSLALIPRTWSAQVLLELTMDVAQRRVPPLSGTLDQTPSGVLFHCEAEDLATVAHFLAGLGCRLIVLHPSELRDELRRLSLHVASLAEQKDGSSIVADER
jgi:predicted DNA-binding transcriptional regulator YafY